MLRYACFWRDEPERSRLRGPERVYALVLADEERKLRVVYRWRIDISDLRDPLRERLVDGHLEALEALWTDVRRHHPETYLEALQLGYHVPPRPNPQPVRVVHDREMKRRSSGRR